LTPSANLTVQIVDGLGAFTYYAAGNTDPDDDETLFLVSGGPAAWVMTLPSFDALYAFELPQNEYIWAKVG
jgi:hypothetical protein